MRQERLLIPLTSLVNRIGLIEGYGLAPRGLFETFARLYQRDPVTRLPALTKDRRRQFGKRGPVQFGAQGDYALDTVRERECSARKRSIGLPDGMQ